nr:unnamed protein product [Callosobruchus analis]
MLRDGSYTITYPRLTPPKKTPGSIHRLHVTAPELAPEFAVDLLPAPTILTQDFLLLESFSNGTALPLPVHRGDVECHLRGTGGRQQAAVSICDHGVTGVLHTKDSNYFLIHPLPRRFHTNTSNPHVLIKKTHKGTKNNGEDYNCQNSIDITEDKPILPDEAKDTRHRSETRIDRRKRETFVNRINRKKRETFPEGAPAFVETAVFVDKDLFEHMKTNYLSETEREVIRFVLAMVNAVQLLYHDPSLGRPVNFVLKRLEIMKEEAPGLLRPPDIDRFLSNFCNWQRTKILLVIENHCTGTML